MDADGGQPSGALAPAIATMNALASKIDAALPQTQCTRCGYPSCAAYAQAVASGDANINQCPPGGVQGIRRLAAITGRPVLPLSEAHGVEGPLTVAVIDEDWCIGCTLCIKACPTDAIVGSHKLMHTVVEPHCTGCELCLPVCPVDCISLVVVNEKSGWDSWSTDQANRARQRFEQRTARLAQEEKALAQQLAGGAQLPASPADTQQRDGADGAEPDQKRAVIQAALAQARARREHPQAASIKADL